MDKDVPGIIGFVLELKLLMKQIFPVSPLHLMQPVHAAIWQGNLDIFQRPDELQFLMGER